VEIPHRAIRRLVCNTDYVSLGPGQILAQAATPLFDAATFEIWGALLTGASLRLLSRQADPGGLADWQRFLAQGHTAAQLEAEIARSEGIYEYAGAEVTDYQTQSIDVPFELIDKRLGGQGWIFGTGTLADPRGTAQGQDQLAIDYARTYALEGRNEEARRYAEKLKAFAPNLTDDELIRQFGRHDRARVTEGLRLMLAPADRSQSPPPPAGRPVRSWC